MARVIPTPTARRDLSEIREYSFEQFGGETADSYFLGFDIVFDLLARHPMAGEARPKLGKDIRCIKHRQHRLFYRVDKDVVLIIRVLHHARDAKRVLGRAGK